MPDNNEDLRRRLARTFGNSTPDQAVNRVRAIVGTTRLPENAEGGLAKDGLAALQRGDEPTPKQLAALELMLRMMRPAPRFIDHTPEDLDPDFVALFPTWPSFQQAIKPFALAVGRIDLVSEDKPLGTGFLVRPNLVMTNRHVLDAASAGTGKLERGQAAIFFGKEFQTPDEAPVDIVGVKAVHDTLDIALLEVDAVAQTPLNVAATGPQKGDMVVAVGFPYNDPARNPLFISTIFGNRFGIKRAAPGDVVNVKQGGQLWQHDCSTLGGNSGSPVFSMTTAQVVGLHFGGGFLWRNDAVDAAVLTEFITTHAH